MRRLVHRRRSRDAVRVGLALASLAGLAGLALPSPARAVSIGELIGPATPTARAKASPKARPTASPNASPTPAATPARPKRTVFAPNAAWSRDYAAAKAKATAEKKPLVVVVLNSVEALAFENRPRPTHQPRYATGTPARELDDKVRELQKEQDEINAQIKALPKKNADKEEKKRLQDRQKELKNEISDLNKQIRKLKGIVLDPEWFDTTSLVLDVLEDRNVAAALAGCVGVIADVRALTSEPAKGLGVTKLPTYFFYRADGTLFDKTAGDTLRPDFVSQVIGELKGGGESGAPAATGAAPAGGL